MSPKKKTLGLSTFHEEPDRTPKGVPTVRSSMDSLVAAAARVRNRQEGKDRRINPAQTQAWQSDAWELYDLVGEFGTAVEAIAKRVSQGRIYVGRLDPAGGDPVELRALTDGADAERGEAAVHGDTRTASYEPDDPLYDSAPMDSEAVEDPEAPIVLDVLRGLGRGASGLSQILLRLSQNLEAAAEGWLVGIPRGYAPEEVFPEWVSDGDETFGPLSDDDPYDYDWHVRSINEIKFNNSDETVTVTELEDYPNNSVTAPADELYLIRVWNPHPSRYMAAGGAPQRALPVMREILGLTMSIGSQIDSRLAGAGLFLVPQSASQAIRAARGVSDERNPMMDDLMEAMLTPIGDRAHPSALVPLMFEVPDESINGFKHLSFATDLDDRADKMRTSAISRLSTMLDIPPEILLGTGGMNHWGGWLVKEETVNSHVSPVLALICHALTTQYLWPMLYSKGIEDPTRYVVWFDVSHLIVRPNHAADALSLHERGVIRDASLRSVHGFDDSDAPAEVKSMDLALSTALDMIRQAPMLAREPGLTQLVTDIRDMLSGPDAAEKNLEKKAEDGGDPLLLEPGEETPDESVTEKVEKGEGGLAGGDARKARIEENPGGRE